MMVQQKDKGFEADIDYDGDYKPTFHDLYYLMKFKVTKILLVSSLYDAFILEEDGLLSKQISGEYQDLELSSPPQVVRVSSGEEALKELSMGRYDLIITMSQLVDLDPFEFGKQAKKIQSGIPVVMLATDPSEVTVFHRPGDQGSIDRVFYWTGDTTLFLAITKFVEDQINVEADIGHGVVKTVLIIEDSPVFYSMFLPIIYTEILRQTRALIAEGLNEHEKWFRKKARPKILLAETFEDAEKLYNKYKEHILTIITDVTFPKDNSIEKYAGFQFIEGIDKDIPVLIQSSHPEHEARAKEMNIPFLNKNSETLPQDLQDFLNIHLGFGEFVFSMPDGTVIGKASDINEFVEIVQNIPGESIRYHALRNQFSTWLMARGEIALALELRPKKVTDYISDEGVRAHLIETIRESRQEKRLGIITNFTQHSFEFEETFTRLGGGSLGGKGRGLAFLSSLLYQSGIRTHLRNIRVRLPDTFVIGTDAFDTFMVENDLYETANADLPDEEIARHFQNAKIPKEIEESLALYLSNVRQPIAVRSSSLLEDSQHQPFAGIYSTYMLPNNCDDEQLRLEQLCQAIKLVYASTFYKRAKAYIQATLHKAEEKMAVIIQKVVGKEFGDRFYPMYSGVGQSYNFYPVTPLKREEGIASVALGLGRIVVQGGKVLSFSPDHPNIIPGLSSPEEILKNTQEFFYALDLSKTCFDLADGEEVTLKALDILAANEDGMLEYLGSTYDINDNRLRDGINSDGPKFITFAGILNYNMIPLVHVIREVLTVGERGMGRPVEIEFAGIIAEDEKPEFYVLQIRPLVSLRERRRVVINEQERINALISTNKALGNGIIGDLRNVVLVPPETFDPAKSEEIAIEIGEINKELKGTPYILIGPGRWGTRDRWLGIPVEWDQISLARTIIEVALEDYRIDPSHGTHFFHNITSLGIMYFTVPFDEEGSFIDWDEFRATKPLITKKFTKLYRLPFSMVVKVDGRSGSGVVTKGLAY